MNRRAFVNLATLTPLLASAATVNASAADKPSILLPDTARANDIGLGEARIPIGEESKGYVLAQYDGEHLIHFRDRGNIFIKISPATGSDNFSLGTQQVTRGAGIPTHRHLHMDEAFYVLEGSGTLTLNDAPHPFEKGATIFIPKNSWHSFANPDRELLLLWLTAPPGLDNFFRKTCSPPGAPPKHLTPAQIKEIARKYGTEFR